MTTYKIALLPGDGIGEETCIEAVKVLDKIEKNTVISLFIINN